MEKNDLLGYSEFYAKDLPLKTASWILSLLLALLLIYSFAQVPAGDSIRALHVASRYQQRSGMETGIHSRTGAILADYRSPDLLTVATLFFTAALCVLLFFNQPPKILDFLSSFLLLALGVLLTLGMGFLCLRTGGNFLDYESLVSWVGPLNARLDGSLALLGGTLLSLGGLLMLWARWIRSPEGPRGR